MFRSVCRVVLQQSLPRSTSFNASPRIPRRLLSTAPPPQKARSWKSSVLRCGLAIGGIYYYYTSDVFAESPRLSQKPLANTPEVSESPTIESLSSMSRIPSRSSPTAGQDGQPSSTEHRSILKESEESEDQSDGVQELEEEADSQGAFNPETGEINWDCPCLGGMAHGPCGEEFKAAFSCFVYSKEDPKGMDCIDKFKGMQDCFRKYPEIYGEELDEDEEDEGKRGNVNGDSRNADSPLDPPSSLTLPPDPPSQLETPEKVPATHPTPSTPDSEQEARGGAKAARKDTKPIGPESEGTIVPKASHDANG